MAKRLFLKVEKIECTVGHAHEKNTGQADLEPDHKNNHHNTQENKPKKPPSPP